MKLSRTAVGVDVGGTSVRIGWVDVSSRKPRILRRLANPTHQMKKPEALVQAVARFVRSLPQTVNSSGTKICGIGLGIPGSVDFSRGIIHHLPNIPAWKGMNLAGLMRQKTGLKTYLDNDANVMALSESVYGAARGASEAVFLTLGTGIGGGLVLGGRLFRGKAFSASEIGHMRYGSGHSAPRCSCGARGCIEAYLGNRQLLEKARAEWMRLGVRQRPSGMKRRDEVSLEALSTAARQGNRWAMGFWGDCGMMLGEFLAGICNLLNPQVIVIGGGVAGAGRPLFGPLKEALKRNAFPFASRHVKVLPASMGTDSGLVGAAELVFFE